MEKDSTDNPIRKAPDHIRKRLFHMHSLAVGLRVVQVMLGITSVTSSVLVATLINNPQLSTGNYLIVIAIIAAVSAGIISAFNLSGKSNRVMDAWRLLDDAVSKYEYLKEYTLEGLIKAKYDAEKMIGKVDYNPAS